MVLWQLPAKTAVFFLTGPQEKASPLHNPHKSWGILLQGELRSRVFVCLLCPELRGEDL